MIKKRRKGRLSRAIIQSVWVSNNEAWNRLRFAAEFPDFEMIPVECERVLMWLVCLLDKPFKSVLGGKSTLSQAVCAGIMHMLLPKALLSTNCFQQGAGKHSNSIVPIFHVTLPHRPWLSMFRAKSGRDFSHVWEYVVKTLLQHSCVWLNKNFFFKW